MTQTFFIANDKDTPEEALYEFLTVVAQIESLLERECNAQLHDEQNILSKLLTQKSDDNRLETSSQSFSYTNWDTRIPEFDVKQTGRIARLAQKFDLTDFELAVLILGCLPRFEPKYAELFSQLQPNSLPLLGLDLALRLFCTGQFIRNAQRASLLADAPLKRFGLLALSHKYKGEQAYQTSSMVYHYFLGHDSLPEALYGTLSWLEPGHNIELDDTALLHCWHHEHHNFPALLELRVAAAMSGEQAAAVLGQRMGMRALLLQSSVLNNDKDLIPLLGQAISAARLHSALLVLQEISVQDNTESPAPSWDCIRSLLNDYPLPLCILIASSSPETPLPSLTRWILPVTLPSVPQRQKHLQQQLSTYPHGLLDYQSLVQRVALPEVDITSAVKEAWVLQHQRGGDQIEIGDLRQAFLRRARQNFSHLAQRIVPVRDFHDLVISDDQLEQLQEILCAIRQRDKTLAQGFARKLGRNTGISVLFYGDSGTGKTLAAEALAHQLGVDMIRVDLSTVINKYIGETEKNLAQIFDLAMQDAGVLFFDEADALFGKRSEAKDAKDRHANIEVAYLLQRLERHPGLVVLATNHRSHLDDAFSRRFTFIVRFAYPDASLRERMWQKAWPKEITLAEDVDFARLAQTALTGANIHNIALLSMWLAGESSAITDAHIQRALRRELSKIGRLPA
ncbi:putative vacuolar sorting ATPase [Xenorhabdus mauleonii]|uniref:ATPase family associated with various cellular activities (AAA) n=1 Tax=Xenorhabdus mauleonii TaxID=351675 RepID=A0A1I3WSP2_9GAMM|nr:ATP-binding protein [Xenorhabdus mauleonii]PHM38153.1 putative vacuolar sorting ATPase [Xenorhabdus mauleonii]SFK10664.1 ATPase family associated with various cellular activities (AAA) [Xenorhabdus mauleonii]